MDKSDWNNIFQAMGLLAQLGIVMIVNIGVAFFLGFFLDRVLSYEMIFKLIGLIFGVISGFYSNYRLISAHMDNNYDNDKK
ncbi:MAG: AtpZ/AtpI family protein [Halanaerobiaceae bacterium]